MRRCVCLLVYMRSYKLHRAAGRLNDQLNFRLVAKRGRDFPFAADHRGANTDTESLLTSGPPV